MILSAIIVPLIYNYFYLADLESRVKHIIPIDNKHSNFTSTWVWMNIKNFSHRICSQMSQQLKSHTHTHSRELIVELLMLENLDSGSHSHSYDIDDSEIIWKVQYISRRRQHRRVMNKSYFFYNAAYPQNYSFWSIFIADKWKLIGKYF